MNVLSCADGADALDDADGDEDAEEDEDEDAEGEGDADCAAATTGSVSTANADVAAAARAIFFMDGPSSDSRGNGSRGPCIPVASRRNTSRRPSVDTPPIRPWDE
jgi:hypothetical protein